MVATSADRRKVATLGAGRGDWCCIGTSLDALGAGARHRPRPQPLQKLDLALCAGLNRSSLSLSLSLSPVGPPPGVQPPGRGQLSARHPYRNVATMVYGGTPVRPPTGSTDPVADLG